MNFTCSVIVGAAVTGVFWCVAHFSGWDVPSWGYFLCFFLAPNCNDR